MFSRQRKSSQVHRKRIINKIEGLHLRHRIFDKESEELFNNLSKSNTIDLLNWLCNNSQIRNRSFYWGNSTIESPLLKKSFLLIEVINVLRFL